MGDVAAGGEGEAGANKKKKGEGLSDFYRFQMRESRKEAEGKLRRDFERDTRRIVEMRKVRGRVRPE